MFIIWGINSKHKKLEHNQVFVCERCGQYGRYDITMTYTCFALFFIPIIKWNRKFFVRTTCCGTVYALNVEIGKAIARGNEVEIKPEHLLRVQGQSYEPQRRCGQCGFATSEKFDFCPKCGKAFE